MAIYRLATKAAPAGWGGKAAGGQHLDEAEETDLGSKDGWRGGERVQLVVQREHKLQWKR